jgi:serine/threonine protein phosphatase PrpC
LCFAAVIDGHGGLSSAAWLQQHLYEDVISRLDQSFLQPDPAAQEVPGRPAVVKPSKVEQTMVEVFQQADNELLQHLLGERGHSVLIHVPGLVLCSPAW